MITCAVCGRELPIQVIEDDAKTVRGARCQDCDWSLFSLSMKQKEKVKVIKRKATTKAERAAIDLHV
jgi:DNA-directed RNA polymerase subunit RPC12/RpoP